MEQRLFGETNSELYMANRMILMLKIKKISRLCKTIFLMIPKSQVATVIFNGGKNPLKSGI